MEEKTLDDEQYGSEEQQETKGFGDRTECGWMQGILGLSGSGDRCLEGGPRVEAIFDVGDKIKRLRWALHPSNLFHILQQVL